MNKQVSQYFVLILAVIAFFVAVIKLCNGDGWILICAYWIVLFIKNFLEYRYNR